MRVIALERGHDGVELREAGEEFEVADNKLDKDGKPADGSTWYAAVAKAPKPKEPAPGGRPPGAGPVRGASAKSE